MPPLMPKRISVSRRSPTITVRDFDRWWLQDEKGCREERRREEGGKGRGEEGTLL